MQTDMHAYVFPGCGVSTFFGTAESFVHVTSTSTTSGQTWQTCGRRVADVVNNVADVESIEKNNLEVFSFLDCHVYHDFYNVFHTSATRLPHLPRSCHATAAGVPRIFHVVPRAFVVYPEASQRLQ